MLPVRRPRTHFVVVARSRTGTNWLIDLLNSHPRVFCHGELFVHVREDDVDAVYGRWRARASPWIEAIGCKVFHYHPAAGPGSKLWSMLERDVALRVIHLRRRDVLASLVSQALASETDTWRRRLGEPATSHRVRMTPEELEHGLRTTREWGRACDLRFQSHPLLQLTYEELVADMPATMERVYRFLGVVAATPRSDLVKQTTLAPSECLLNWPELQARFADTEWAPYFR